MSHRSVPEFVSPICHFLHSPTHGAVPFRRTPAHDRAGSPGFGLVAGMASGSGCGKCVEPIENMPGSFQMAFGVLALWLRATVRDDIACIDKQYECLPQARHVFLQRASSDGLAQAVEEILYVGGDIPAVTDDQLKQLLLASGSLHAEELSSLGAMPCEGAWSLLVLSFPRKQQPRWCVTDGRTCDRLPRPL
jgi:hypothetical protein